MSLNFDIDINDLNLENMGSWPKAAKVIFAGVTSVAVMIITYLFLVSGNIEQYENAVTKESELRNLYRAKYSAAANLDLYRQQMQDMEDKLSSLLKRLPATHETAGLLDDITYVGTTSGLTFVKMYWMPEIEKEFYRELPIKIEVVGSYHEFGEFVSKIAALPRIVSLHDFDIKNDEGERLRLNVVAKTYTYKESES